MSDLLTPTSGTEGDNSPYAIRKRGDELAWVKDKGLMIPDWAVMDRIVANIEEVRCDSWAKVETPV